MDEARYTVRRMAASELPLLRNSWFLSARTANAEHRAMGDRVYGRWMDSLISDTLATLPDIFVADDGGLVLGYAVGVPCEDSYIVAYVYVKSHSRRAGIARALVASLAEIAGDRPLLSGIHCDRHAAIADRYTSGRGSLEAALGPR